MEIDWLHKVEVVDVVVVEEVVVVAVVEEVVVGGVQLQGDK
jgi:hypothetical protein